VLPSGTRHPRGPPTWNSSGPGGAEASSPATAGARRRRTKPAKASAGRAARELLPAVDAAAMDLAAAAAETVAPVAVLSLQEARLGARARGVGVWEWNCRVRDGGGGAL